MADSFKEQFYYKYLTIDIDQGEIDYFNKLFPFKGSCFKLINSDIVKTLLPKIYNWFEDYKIEIDNVCLIHGRPGWVQDIHRDHRSNNCNVLALNIPLFVGAENSITRFFELKNPAVDSSIKTLTNDSGVPYYRYKEKDLKLATYYKLTGPVLINVGKIHGVINPPSSPRGVLSFRFKKDPWFLINESEL